MPDPPSRLGRWARLLPPRDAATVVLLSGGAYAVSRAWAYTPYTTDGGIQLLTVVEEWAPLPVWTVLWCVIGALLLASAWYRRASILSLSALAGINAAWGVSYVWAWADDGVDRGWVTGAMFLAIAGWAAALPGLIERQER